MTRPVQVIVKPTGAQCNLRCDYCFYLEKRALYPDAGSLAMTDQTLEQFTRQYLEASASGGEAHFNWQGGEPTLLGIDFFRRAVTVQKKHIASGLKVRAVNAIQTNGTLLDDEWGRFLSAEGFLVGLSLDGPEDLHDAFRRDGQGRGSFKAARNALELLKRHRVPFNTLTVVNARNALQPEAVYSFLKNSGVRHMQFIPLVERTHGKGELTDRSVSAEAFGNFLVGVFERWKAADVGRVYVQYFDMMVALALGLPASLCVHAETCGLGPVVEHNGDVYTCDHFVDESNRLGRIGERTLAEWSDAPKLVAFGEAKKIRLPSSCRVCSYRAYCGGGCPGHRISAEPDEEHPRSHLCAGYRIFFEHTGPTFEAMAECVRRGLPARNYRRFLGASDG